ncbi:MAG: hypothetical protein LBB11_03555 [Puniceicoccales bacterium]|jgi:hypothetical protein|nr:hypothetical protein [Puniceicoccales bacterium]
MNASEEFFKEDKEEGTEEGIAKTVIEASSAENALIGDPSSSTPDTTILGDLNHLANLTFGTRWSQDESPRHPTDRSQNFSRRRSTNHRHSQFNRENDYSHTKVDQQPLPLQGKVQQARDFRPSRRFDGHHREYRVFVPHFEVQFFQEEQSFTLLLNEMRKNCKTYELFTIARLILQKPERFVLAIRRRPDQEGTVAPLYLSLLDDLVFDSEHEAMAYIMQQHLEEFFDVLEESVEPPKGRFTCIHRCGVTKKLLSAPNYHKYKTILRNHFNSEIHTMSFERFIDKIETTKEETDIQNWIQQMERKLTYIPKIIDDAVTDLDPIDSLEGVKNYLLKYFKERIIREVITVRIAGTRYETIPSKTIVRAIQFFLHRQRQFPLDTAKNIRNRFRRAGFSTYRYGKNNISYVCASKRRFRLETDVFEPNIQQLIEFLESLEKITLANIEKDYIRAHGFHDKEVFDRLNWLIREGYVVAYENGALYLNPKSTLSKNKRDVSDKRGSLKDEGTTATEDSAIQLEMVETAIEKFSDGTLTLSPETTLTVISPEPIPSECSIKGENADVSSEPMSSECSAKKENTDHDVDADGRGESAANFKADEEKI